MFRSNRWSSGAAQGAVILMALTVLIVPAMASAEEMASQPSRTSGQQVAAMEAGTRQPVYHIPVRVHLKDSGRAPREFLPILNEMNGIWLTQAGICFEMQIAVNNEVGTDGMDIWFLPELGGGEMLNGFYRGDHEIQVRDTPDLGPAAHPARFPAARTAAHELGHGLGLSHRQDSDDNLMRSKTLGWQLNDEEVRRARETAKEKALTGVSALQCGPVQP